MAEILKECKSNTDTLYRDDVCDDTSHHFCVGWVEGREGTISLWGFRRFSLLQSFMTMVRLREL